MLQNCGGLALLAPALYVLILAAILWVKFKPPPAPDPSPFETRRVKRNMQRLMRQHERRLKGRKCGSIRDFNLHRRYPTRLRSEGHYVGAAPRVELQALQRQTQVVQKRIQAILTRLNQRGTNAARRRGRWVPRPSDMADMPQQSSPWTSLSQRRQRTRARGRPATENLYRPVPASGHHGLGNNGWTRKQKRALEKVDVQFHMHRVAAGVDKPSTPVALRVALQAPARFRRTLPKDATFPVIWDSGASFSLSFDKSDFVGSIQPVDRFTRLRGIAKGLQIAGRGHVLWAFHDSAGSLRIVRVPAFYVPNSKVRLLSTTNLLQTYKGEEVVQTETEMRLTGVQNDPTRGELVAKVNPMTNLPTAFAYRPAATGPSLQALNSTISTVHQDNMNLSEAEKELLRWHYRLGHMSFERVQFLMRTGVLAHSVDKRRLQTAACKLKTPPKCAACQFGKQHRRRSPGTKNVVVKDESDVLKADHLMPGQCVSVDHFVCSTKGRLFTSRGKSLDSDMYMGGCVFVDHASSFVHVEFQSHLNTHETAKAKEAYELLCRDFGVVPQSYVSDNGKAFTSKGFMQHLAKFAQVIRFAGTGAHHHNAIAERMIGVITSMARTSMLHAAIHWPDVADPALWPMAVAHAVFLYNHMPNPKTGLSPHDVFSRTRWPQRKFHDLHVWGAPCYTLEKALADGKKLPRWTTRSERMIYMGLSSKHATSIPLVLNPETGSLTPPFHVVFDDWFATVASSVESLPDFNSPEWARHVWRLSVSVPLWR